jgi:hypothetical protein
VYCSVALFHQQAFCYDTVVSFWSRLGQTLGVIRNSVKDTWHMQLQGFPFPAGWSVLQRRAALAITATLVTAVLVLACMLQSTTVAWLSRLGITQPYPWANTMSLQSVSMVSADNGWAVGHISGKPTTLLMRYSRGQWTILPKPVGLDNQSEFTAVSMVSAHDGWAWASMPIPIGDRYHSFRPGGVLLHYDGNSWKITTPVFPIGIGSDPSALLMLSPTDGWATGEGTTLHYDGTAWREVTALSDKQWGGGSAIAAGGPDDIWIARFGGDIIHYDGTSWSEQQITLPLPFAQQAPGPIVLTGIAMTSPEAGYAVGSIGNSSSGVILRYVGSRWLLVRTVDENLSSISLRPATRSTPEEGWAVGGSNSLYHDVDGVWSKVTSPISCPLYGVTTLPASSDTWAVGLCGALLRYHDGRWQQETNVVWSQDAKAEWR